MEYVPSPSSLGKSLLNTYKEGKTRSDRNIEEKSPNFANCPATFSSATETDRDSIRKVARGNSVAIKKSV